jgi:hypothetical protein
MMILIKYIIVADQPDKRDGGINSTRKGKGAKSLGKGA